MKNSISGYTGILCFAVVISILTHGDTSDWKYIMSTAGLYIAVDFALGFIMKKKN